jgi:hypothetical protein
MGMDGGTAGRGQRTEGIGQWTEARSTSQTHSHPNSGERLKRIGLPPAALVAENSGRMRRIGHPMPWQTAIPVSLALTCHKQRASGRCAPGDCSNRGGGHRSPHHERMRIDQSSPRRAAPVEWPPRLSPRPAISAAVGHGAWSTTYE